jgi:hypothetical protein
MDDDGKIPQNPDMLLEALMRQITALEPFARRRLGQWMSAERDAVTTASSLAHELRTAGAAYQATPSVGVRLHNVEAAFQLPALDDRDALVFEALIAAARAILRTVPACGDRDGAIHSLREARWQAHSAILNHGAY